MSNGPACHLVGLAYLFVFWHMWKIHAVGLRLRPSCLPVGRQPVRKGTMERKTGIVRDACFASGTDKKVARAVSGSRPDSPSGASVCNHAVTA